MRGALAVDIRVNFGQMVAQLFDGQHFHAHAVRNLVAQVIQRLLANDFGAHHALRLVGDHVLREVHRPLGHALGNQLIQHVHVFAGSRGHGNDALKALGVQRGQLRHQLFRRHDVDFVDGEEARAVHRLHAFHDLRVLRPDMLAVHDHEHRVHALARVVRGLYHVFAQLRARLVDTGGVHEHDLCVLSGGNT